MSSRRTFLLAAAAMGLPLATWRAISTAKAAETPRTIAIEARRFQYTPREIAVKQGEAVVLEFTSIDFVHGFNLPRLKIRSNLLPGIVTRIPVTFPEAGRIPFLCDNFCGSGHEEMNGVFVVSA